MSVTHILLVRHGRTEWNREDRFRGRADIALDELGTEQAQATGERIAAGWPVSALYCSPLKRACTTAEIIGRRTGHKPLPLDGIVDMDFGSWEGLSRQQAREGDEDLYRKWQHEPERVRFPGGESLEDVRRRAGAVLDDLIIKHEGQTIVLVTHRVVCMLLILHVLEIATSHFWQIGQDVCALNLFQVRDGVSYALMLNDTGHLKDLQ